MVFYLPKMKSDIATWVAECDICQRVKSKNVHYPGLLHGRT